jgi:lipoprotein-anchoring transpeptidase ErfK/SrfK
MNPITRRQFLGRSTFVSAGVVLNLPFFRTTMGNTPRSNSTNQGLGRVFSGGASSYSEPNLQSSIASQFKENEILTLHDPITTSGQGAGKSLWYRIDDGSFIHSSAVQPVRNKLNAPNMEVGSNGRIAEVTVPFTDAWSSSSNGRKPNQIFYYGTTHWVYGLGQDKEKNYYYLIREDRWGDVYYVDATHVRVIPEDELQPISPNVPEKLKTIKIYLDEQIMLAYEGEKPVFMSPIASGLLTGNVDFTTPKGNFIINYKRPSRHMAHSERFGSNGGELFGVPWVSYFTNTGIAFHGTYWHNDYTHPKSHGCINMPIQAAKWVYLWTYPVISPRQEKHVSQYGTSIEIL